MRCVFCDIIAGSAAARIVFEDSVSQAFLDARPLFPGHCLLVPKMHVATLEDLQDGVAVPFFRNVRRLAAAVRLGMRAEGAFVAINNRVSQSVPHLHVHVVPRRKGDGLKGFFWPRHAYANEDEAAHAQEAIRAALSTQTES